MNTSKSKSKSRNFLKWSRLASSLSAVALLACGDAMEDHSHHPMDMAQMQMPTEYTVSEIAATLETENIDDAAGNVDDPSIWVHPTDASKSLVIAAIKDGGLRVYGLQGQSVQSIGSGPLVHDATGKSRYNNVDVVYGFKLADGRVVDLAVASDRGQDLIRIWQIDTAAAMPLTDITSDAPLRVFPTQPLAGSEKDATKDESVPVKEQSTVYGITHYSDKASGQHFVLVNQRSQARIVQLELVAEPGGKVNVKPVSGRDWRFPYSHKGQDLREENEDDASRDWSPQFEGMTVDQRNGTLYAGQEDVGIWRIELRTGRPDVAPFYETRGSGREFYTETPAGGGTPTQHKHSFYNPDSKIARDVEGLTIYYGEGGTGYLLASSQGSAHGDGSTLLDAPYDDSFAVFALNGTSTPVLRSGFHLTLQNGGGPGKSEGVQECDGAEVLALALPGFPFGVLVTQDGYNDDLNNLDGAQTQTNLKFTSWEPIAAKLGLEKNSRFDPRNP